MACALVVVVGGVGISQIARYKVSAKESENSGLMVNQVIKQDLAKSISVTGTISSAASYNVVGELSNVEVTSVNVQVGDQVKKGDVLATLDDTDVQNALNNAQDGLNLQQQKNQLDIASAERSYNDGTTTNQTAVDRAGQDVQTAQNDLNNANGKVTTAQTNYNNAVVDRQNKELAANNAKTALDQANAQVNTAQNDLNNANVSGDSNAINTATAALEQAKAQADSTNAAYTTAASALEDARTKEATCLSSLNDSKDAQATANTAVTKAQQSLEDAKRAQTKGDADNADSVKSSKISAETSLQSAKDEVTKQEKEVQKATILAPADGVVTSVAVKTGDLYKGDTMFIIQDDSGYKVSASVDQYDISDIAQGLSATIKTDTTGDEEMTGQLTFVSPTPKSATVTNTSSTETTTNSQTTGDTSGNYPIEVTINNPSDRLRIGMTAKLTIIEQEEKDALTVPDSCVQQDADGSYYVELAEDADGDGYADSTDTKKIKVTYGIKTDYYVSISGKGLEEGMYVVEPTDSSMDDSADMGSDGAGISITMDE